MVMNLGLRGALNRERSALGLPPVRDVLTHWAGERVIAATDAALTRLPEGAIPKAVQTGYMHLRQHGTLDEALERFLGAGPVPTYVGFGSTPILRPSALVSRVVSVARSQDRRFVVLARDLPPGVLAEEPRCFVTGNVPHERLFPRVAAVVHHGGAGTVAAAARAGVPQVVVPLMNDQPHWRSQVVALGLGPGGPGFKRMTERNLGQAVAACLSEPAYARRAREVAAAIACTDGVALTVALIERDHDRSRPAGST
jgi:vancomycin aglycone glucosyltransferase